MSRRRLLLTAASLLLVIHAVAAAVLLMWPKDPSCDFDSNCLEPGADIVLPVLLASFLVSTAMLAGLATAATYVFARPRRR